MLSTMYHYGILVATLFVYVLADEEWPHSERSDQETQQTSQALLPLPTTAPSDDHEATVNLWEFCFFEKYPSALCRFKCHYKDMEAYCDQEEKKCLCRPPTIDTTEEEENSQEMFDTPKPFKGLFQTPSPDTATDSTQTDEEEGNKGDNAHLAMSVHPAQPTPGTTQTDDDEDGSKKHHVVFYIFDLNKIFGHKEGDAPEPDVIPTPVAESGEVSGDNTPAAAGWNFQHIVALLIVMLLVLLITLELFACYKKQSNKNNMETIFKTIPIPNKA